jgi:RimK-like ATP-grasp domain
MSVPEIVLLARRAEFNLPKIESVLQHRKAKYCVVTPSYDDARAQYTAYLGSEGGQDAFYGPSGELWPLDRVKSVWTRGVSYAGDDTPAINTVANRAVAETAHAFNHLWSRLSDRCWVNPLPSLDRVNRLTQCSLAQGLGLAVPASIVSNRGDDIRRFVQAHGDCIVKPISQGGRTEMGPGLVMAERFPGDAVLEDRLAVPMLVQKFVEKDHEIRAAVVAGRVFAAAIDSTADEKTAVDSRNWFQTDLSYYRVRLAEDEQRALTAINADLGYAYSSMDLIRSPNGRLTFLEANPSGQWTFMEGQTGYAITEAIADMLCK